MKLMRIMAIMAIMTACALSITANAAHSSQKYQTAVKSSASENAEYSTAKASEIVRQVNAERVRLGLNPLGNNDALSKAAMTRAKELKASFSHTRPDGSSWATVCSAAFGENIAKGYTTVDKVMAAWLTSKGHRANILKKSYSSIGVAACNINGIMYWVQLFGKD